MENIEFRGISENSTPLGASDLKLLQGGYKRGDDVTYIYTVVGVLRKNSTVPDESFFEVSIALIDEFGRYIGNEQSITLPSISGRNAITLLTAQSSQHLELEIHPLSDIHPVAVEFTAITEISKTEFVQTNLLQAEDYLRNQDFDEARKSVELVLRVDSNNTEALELLERVNEMEQEYLETQQVPDPTPTLEPTPELTPEPTPTPEPSPTPEQTPSPTPEIVQPSFPSEYALRAAVVAFTNFFADDIYTDDGHDYDLTKLHSFSDLSGELSDYFMFVVNDGVWTPKNENTWSVEGLALERYTTFIRSWLTDRLILSFSISITASLDVHFDGENYVISNLIGTTSNHDDLNWIENDTFSMRALFIVNPELISEDRDADAVTALDRRRNRSTDFSVAERAFMDVGNALYPYGFRAHWILGLEERTQAHDGSWYIRVEVTVTNAFGTSRRMTGEAVVNFTTNMVEDFRVF